MLGCIRQYYIRKVGLNSTLVLLHPTLRRMECYSVVGSCQLLIFCSYVCNFGTHTAYWNDSCSRLLLNCNIYKVLQQANVWWLAIIISPTYVSTYISDICEHCQGCKFCYRPNDSWFYTMIARCSYTYRSLIIIKTHKHIDAPKTMHESPVATDCIVASTDTIVVMITSGIIVFDNRCTRIKGTGKGMDKDTKCTAAWTWHTSWLCACSDSI